MSFVTPGEVVGHLHLADKMVVADLGAGTGAYCFALADLIKRENIQEATIYAVDVQKAMLEHLRADIAHRGYSGIETLWADIEVPGGVKLADRICDAVVISNVLFQSEPEARTVLAREAVRILKPGGQMLVLDWTGSFGSMGPHPAQVMTAAMAKELLTKAGLTVANEFSAGSHHWGLLLRRAALQSTIARHDFDEIT